MFASLVVSAAAARLFAPLARDAAPLLSAGVSFQNGPVAASEALSPLLSASGPSVVAVVGSEEVGMGWGRAGIPNPQTYMYICSHV